MLVNGGLMAHKICKSASKYLVVFLALETASCGTILYPERRGQPAGRIDPGVVVLDAVGLLVFFIPGIVAFAVDFSNGTIYLPPEPMVFPCTANSRPFQTIRVPPAELTSRRLETILQEHTGQPVRLQAGTYRVARVNDVQDFTARTVNGLQSGPAATSVVFRGTSE
jgi:hypothetical protein